MLGVEEDRGDFNWIYDPGHPDAAKDGPHQGYLAKPNINVLQEAACLAQCDNEQQAIRLVLQRLDPDLIISPSFADVVPDRSASLSSSFSRLSSEL